MSNENTENNTEVEDNEESDDGSGVPNLYEKKELTKVTEETQVIKTKRKYHPNEENYRGDESTQETMVKEIEFMGSLTDEQSDKFIAGKLIFDEDKLNSYWNEIRKNDIVGFQGNVYRVDGKTKATLTLSRRKPKRYRNDEDTYAEETKKVSRYDLDHMMNIGFTEILYRDGKPYGVSEDLEYKINVALWEDKDGNKYTTQKGREIKQKQEEPQES